MGLLWLTMVTAFTNILIGFQWFKDGFTLSQVATFTIVGALILLAYSIPASYLGSKSGQTYGMLSRQVFGRWGSRLASFNLIWITIAWYALGALMLANWLDGLYHIKLPIMIVAAGLSILMAFNNFFGFTGVANFARYVAAPMLFAVMLYTFAKVLHTCPTTVLKVAPHMPPAAALSTIAGFVIGVGVWGNEPDFWRFGQPRKRFPILPLAISLSVGQVIFPITGWMAGRISGLTDYGFGPATNFMNDYSFGGVPLIAAVVLTAISFAMNDSNLYGMINAVENIKTLPHTLVCGMLAILCAAFAAWLSVVTGVRESLEAVACLSCVILPAVTVVMIVEFFVIRRILGLETNFAHVPTMSEVSPVRWPALIALIAGCSVGILTSGIIPGSAPLRVGLCPLQAWIVAAVVYLALRLREHKLVEADRRLLYDQLQRVQEPEVDRVS
jgi:purine-cytosine permease-like protein